MFDIYYVINLLSLFFIFHKSSSFKVDLIYMNFEAFQRIFSKFYIFESFLLH